MTVTPPSIEEKAGCRHTWYTSLPWEDQGRDGSRCKSQRFRWRNDESNFRSGSLLEPSTAICFRFSSTPVCFTAGCSRGSTAMDAKGLRGGSEAQQANNDVISGLSQDISHMFWRGAWQSRTCRSEGSVLAMLLLPPLTVGHGVRGFCHVWTRGDHLRGPVIGTWSARQGIRQAIVKS